MSKNYFNLRLFAEGASAEGAGAEGGLASQGAEETVVYGVAAEEPANDHPKDGTDAAKSESNPKKSFEELIKGEYKQDFDARVKGILENRLKNAKDAEERLKGYDPVFELLAQKYGVDTGDPKALYKVLDQDASFYEEAAMKRGMSVNDYRQLRQIERENEELRQAIETADKTQKEQEKAKAIYAEWIQQAEGMKERYPGFDLKAEMENNEFLQFMQIEGMTVENAYIHAHLNEIQPQLMKITADRVERKVVDGLRSRNNRPAENAAAAYNASVVRKTDPSKLTDKDIEEIERRARRGERISFG